MKKNICYSLTLYVVCTFFFQSQAIAGDAKTQLESYLNTSRTFESSFEQSLFTEAGVLQEVASGKFYLSRPGKFRWNYSDPYEQDIIADGEKIWIYDIDLEQVTVRKMSDVLSNTPALLLSNDLAISDDFLVTVLDDQEKYEWFLLEPKDKENQYIDIRFAFDKTDIKVMELRDNFGQLTRILFLETKVNAQLDEGMFNFQPPEGVDVLDTIE